MSSTYLIFLGILINNHKTVTKLHYFALDLYTKLRRVSLQPLDTYPFGLEQLTEAVQVQGAISA